CRAGQIENRKSAIPLSFMSQRLNRLNPACAPRRKKTRQQSCNNQDRSDCAEGTHIHGANSVQGRLHCPTNQISASQSNKRSHERQNHSFRYNLPDNSHTLGTKRHANAKFLGALRNTKRHHTVDTHRCQQQTNQSKAAKQHDAKPIDSQRLIHKLVDSFQSSEWQFGIHRINCGSNALDQAFWINVSTDNHRSLWPRALPERNVDLRIGVVSRSRAEHVVKDTNDLVLHGLSPRLTRNLLVD